MDDIWSFTTALNERYGIDAQTMVSAELGAQVGGGISGILCIRGRLQKKAGNYVKKELLPYFHP